MLEVYDTNYTKFSHADLVLNADDIVVKLSCHPRFKDYQWPDVVPGPSQIKDLVLAFKEAVSAAANGDRVKIAEKHAARIELVEAVTMTAQHIVMVWKKEKDPAVLQNTGFPMKKTKAKAKNTNHAGTTATPTKVTACHGAESGTVEIKVGRVKGVASYHVQRCLGVPTDATSWDDIDSFVYAHFIIKGQEPGLKYSFRVRCFGAAGYSDWSAPVTLIVI